MNTEFTDSYEKEKVMRKIMQTYREGLTNDIRWDPEPDAFYSGNAISCTVDGIAVCGYVEFDSVGLSVKMTVPYESESGWCVVFYRHTSFFRRNPTGIRLTTDGKDDGPASALCIDKAHRILLELYRDYLVIMRRAGSIRTKMAEYPTFEKQFLEEERIRTEKVKERLAILSSISAKIKADFKAGKFKQPEYCARKAPVKEEIRLLQTQRYIRNPFGIYFDEELDWCLRDRNKVALIRHAAASSPTTME